MGEISDLSLEIREAIEGLRRATRVERVIVFGSRATGTAGPDSDVDLVLIDPRFEGVKSFKRSPPFRRHWPALLPVDMLCYTPAEFEALKARPTLAREAAEHGVEA